MNEHATNLAVIFDVDGTLWDSAPGIVSCLRETLEAFDLPVPGDDELRSHLGPPLDTMLVNLGIPTDRVEDARAIYRRGYRDHGEFECDPYPGIVDLLEALHGSGRPLGVATSKGVEVVLRMLDHFDLARWFHTVQAAPMASSHHGKEHLVAAALEDLGADGGVMIGDRNFDIAAGRAHGLRTIGVRWGYADPGELEEAGADVIVATVDELAAVLTRG